MFVSIAKRSTINRDARFYSHGCWNMHALHITIGSQVQSENFRTPAKKHQGNIHILNSLFNATRGFPIFPDISHSHAESCSCVMMCLLWCRTSLFMVSNIEHLLRVSASASASGSWGCRGQQVSTTNSYNSSNQGIPGPHLLSIFKYNTIVNWIYPCLYLCPLIYTWCRQKMTETNLWTAPSVLLPVQGPLEPPASLPRECLPRASPLPRALRWQLELHLQRVMLRIDGVGQQVGD